MKDKFKDCQWGFILFIPATIVMLTASEHSVCYSVLAFGKKKKQTNFNYPAEKVPLKISRSTETIIKSGPNKLYKKHSKCKIKKNII